MVDEPRAWGHLQAFQQKVYLEVRLPLGLCADLLAAECLIDGT